MIFFNLIVKWIKLDFNKWQTWVLGTWAFQQCSPESCIILWPLCPALHTLFHAWRDFGLAFDWRTWLVVCPSSCRHAPAFSALLISCHTLPLFTQTHQRQRRIQIVLMDFSPSNIPNPYTDIKLTQCILEQEQNSIENKKKKMEKRMGWDDKKNGWYESGTIFVFYAIFTDDCHHVWVTELAPFSAAWFANRFATLFMSVSALLIIRCRVVMGSTSSGLGTLGLGLAEN